MKRKISDTNRLTLAEHVLIQFLFDHKGEEFTAEELEEHSGVRASNIPDIITNLQWKGYEVCAEPIRGVYYFPKNTWVGYLIGGLIFGSMMSLIIWAI